MNARHACLIVTGLVLAIAPDRAQDQSADGIEAFRNLASVLTSPRCLNCHVAAQGGPRQGDDNHVHAMRVARGPDGGGAPGARCATCHQQTNAEAPHAPPGAADWKMPGPVTPMAWEGLTLAQLCQAVRTPATNGQRSLAMLVEHAESDALVLWGWNPGSTRGIPPRSHDSFVADMKRWTAAGAPCPED